MLLVTIVLPTRNEATIIRASIAHLLAFLNANVREEWRIIVADNASTDATRAIVREIAAQEPCVELLEIPESGKGGAVLAAWCHAVESREYRVVSPYANESSHASRLTPHAFVFMFMDADLATDIAALPALIAAIRNGADIAIGSRYLPNSRTERGPLRRITSWCYRALLRFLFGLRVSDPPCGFKAVNARVVREIVPQVSDRQWFFDTELLIRAQRAGMRIADTPVTWREPRRSGSLVKVLRIIANDLRAIAALRRELRDA